MEIILVDKLNKDKFIKFQEKQYLNSPIKRNSMSKIIKDLLNGKTVLCKSADLWPLMVVDNDKIIMACILALAHRMPHILQISFFESEFYNEEAFKLVLDYAKMLARDKGVKEISGSLNIHVNYGLGFLSQGYDKWQSFGTAHNPPFYNTYFEKAGFKSLDMVSFFRDIKSLDNVLSSRLEEKLNKRYRVRNVDFKNLKEEAKIYTYINNEAFSDHPFYYERDEEEDLELFKDFRYLLKNHNLLFVEREGIAVGFMLWYPDFNEIMKPSETLGLLTVIKNKLYGNRIERMKIVEIGVLAKEQNRGAILALFNHVFHLAGDKYKYLETGWILEENAKSFDLAARWTGQVHKKYKAYTLKLD